VTTRKIVFPAIPTKIRNSENFKSGKVTTTYTFEGFIENRGDDLECKLTITGDPEDMRDAFIEMPITRYSSVKIAIISNQTTMDEHIPEEIDKHIKELGGF